MTYIELLRGPCQLNTAGWDSSVWMPSHHYPPSSRNGICWHSHDAELATQGVVTRQVGSVVEIVSVQCDVSGVGGMVRFRITSLPGLGSLYPCSLLLYGRTHPPAHSPAIHFSVVHSAPSSKEVNPKKPCDMILMRFPLKGLLTPAAAVPPGLFLLSIGRSMMGISYFKWGPRGALGEMHFLYSDFKRCSSPRSPKTNPSSVDIINVSGMAILCTPFFSSFARKDRYRLAFASPSCSSMNTPVGKCAMSVWGWAYLWK